MYPILIEPFGFPITTYGLMAAVAFVTFWFCAVSRGRKLGYDSDFLQNLMTIIVISAMVGARLLHIAVNVPYYVANPSQILAREGYVFLGGFVVAVSISIWYIRRHKQSVLGVADLFAPFLPLAHAIGRVGCFLFGCCWGAQCSANVGVRFPQESPAWFDQVNRGLLSPEALHSLPVHATQLYSVGANLTICGLLLLLRTKQTFKGQLAMSYLILYSIARTVIEHFRDDPRGLAAGLSTSQWLGILLLATGTIGYWVLSKKHIAPDMPKQEPSPSA
ncbi:MAG: prolipoprotein diacylglyceryl transferase [Candidatus Hinthialibacter antarcticus]|nr:prolipoprotein diacylglyceryl transferase [Candidatus Hinthialibacter antarcticus]